MPLVDCGQVDLSAVVPVSVDLNKFSAIGADPCEVKLQNESPLSLLVTIAGNQHKLGAWTVDKFPLCGQTTFQVVPSQIQVPAPTGVPSNVLLITVAPEGESIPGTYPAALPRMTASSITAGQVTFTNAQIGVQNVAGTKITSARPAKLLGTVSTFPGGNPTTTNMPLDPDVQALVIVLSTPPANLVHVKVAWHIPGDTTAWLPLELFQFSQTLYVVPILPSTLGQGGNTGTSVDVTLQTVGTGWLIAVYELFEANPLWLEFFAPPFAEPNQVPKIFDVVLTVAGTYYPLIPAVANVQINLFDIYIGTLLLKAGSVNQFDIGYGPDAAHVTNMTEIVQNSPGAADSYMSPPPGILPFVGASLGRGNGLWASSFVGGSQIGGSLIYSLG